MVPTVALPFAIPSTVQAAWPPPGTVAVNCWVRVSVSVAFCGARLMLTLDTVSVADATALAPPGPLQLNVYVVVVLTRLVSCVPLFGKVPLQPSPAVHSLALVESQVNVELSPGATTDGYTLTFTVGITLTVVLAFELPPGPEQDREYDAATVNGAVLWVPLRFTAPLHAPDALHDVAPVELHDSTAA
jgi:hypothetical protein